MSAAAARAAPSSTRTGAGAVRAAAHGLTFLGTALIVLISPMVLHLWGVAYELPGGTALEKIHPGTLVVFAALALLMLDAGNPLRFLARECGRAPGLFVFLASWLVLLQHIILVQRAPFTPIIDSFLLPMALFVCIRDGSPSFTAAMARFLHVFMCANACLGLYEVASGWRLTPFVAADLEIELDWRASALLGHPLANAALTGVYTLVLAQGGGRAMPGLARAPVIALQLAAMVAFGGRASLVFLLALLLFIALRGGARVLSGGRVSLAQAGLFLICLPLALAALDQAVSLGFFDRIAERFVNDRGSAKARLVMFDILAQISWTDLILGPDQELVAALQRREGVEVGIESVWIGFILSYGIIASVLFFAGAAFFCRELVRATRGGVPLLLVFFFGVASTSVSLSAKSTMFGVFTAFALTMLARPRGP